MPIFKSPRSSSNLYKLWQRMVPNIGYQLDGLKDLCLKEPVLLEGTAHNLVHQGVERKYVYKLAERYYRSDSVQKESLLPKKTPSGVMEIEPAFEVLSQKMTRLKRARAEREEVIQQQQQLIVKQEELTTEIKKIQEELAPLREFFPSHAA